MIEIRLRPEVEGDLLEASIWYEQQRTGLGADFLGAVDVTLSRISASPSAYPTVHESLRRALLPRFPFGVFYHFEASKIVVIAIFHCSRHPRYWRGRL
jgi:toxin ParE1/3/4